MEHSRLKERGDVAVLVGQHLELDVARALDELFHVEFAVAEGVGSFRAGGVIEVWQVFGIADDSHAAPATAGLGLRITGKPTFFVHSCASSSEAMMPSEPGRIGTLAFLHGLARFFLFTHEARDLGRRADELDIRGAADFGEVGVLAQQAVAGVDGVHVSDFRGGDDGGHTEIAVRGTRRADADGFIGKADVERVTVGLAVNSDRADAEFPGRR